MQLQTIDKKFAVAPPACRWPAPLDLSRRAGWDEQRRLGQFLKTATSHDDEVQGFVAAGLSVLEQA
jgi:hypothetical protein